MEALTSTATQHSVHPTGGSRRVFGQFVWLEVDSVKAAFSRPAHPRVTQAVGWVAHIRFCIICGDMTFIYLPY